jgi:hypothetical protein
LTTARSPRKRSHSDRMERVQELPPPDQIALRIERNVGEDYAAELQRDIDEGRARGAEVRHFGRAIALAKHGWPGCQVFCFSADEVERLPEILAFFGRHAPEFYLSSNGFSAQVGQALAAVGFYQHDLGQTLTYGAPHESLLPPPSGIEIERVDGDSVELFLDVMAEGFGWEPAWREAAKDKERRALKQPGYHPFLAYCEGEPAGTGVLKTKGDLGNVVQAATVPRFRRKGCQLALLHRRLFEAGRLGCGLVMSGARYGSSSLRNQHRAGLRMAYIESGWTKRP